MAVQSAANPPLTCGPKLPWPAGQRKPRKPYPPRHDHVRGIVVADIVVASAKADATIYCHPHPLNNLLQPTHTSVCVQALRSHIRENYAKNDQQPHNLALFPE